MPPNVARTPTESILAFKESAMQDIQVDEALWASSMLPEGIVE
jgi:hypothetical protein